MEMKTRADSKTSTNSMEDRYITTRTVTTRIRQDDRLSRLYDFRDDLVASFLEENPSLGELLFAAHKVVYEHFGPEAEMALEVVTDPEAPEDQELFVVIRTKFPPKDARALLSEIDRGWWRDVSPAAQGKMELALE